VIFFIAILKWYAGWLPRDVWMTEKMATIDLFIFGRFSLASKPCFYW
jgi:hypothetical protein